MAPKIGRGIVPKEGDNIPLWQLAAPRPPQQNARVLVNGLEPSISHWWLVPVTLLGIAVLLFLKVAFSNKRLG